MNKIKHYLDFLKVWNNYEEYNLVADVADKLNVTEMSAIAKAKRYRYLLQRKPELNLPPILDRKKVTKDGLTYSSHEIEITKSAEIDKTKTRFIITCAQYGADVNDDFLGSLKTYSKENNAQLIVAPVRYGVSHDAIDGLLDDYVTYKNLNIGKHVEINLLGITPTVMNPLVGLHRYASKRSQIFPHPQIAFEPVPRSNINLPKAIMTTGSITYPLYGFNKASEQAEFEHRFGAVVIELDGDLWHFRHIYADEDGNFNDIVDGKPSLYTQKGTYDAFVDTLVCGDWHTGETNPEVRQVTFESIVPMLEPDNIVMHDFFNGESVSHHDENDAILMAKKALRGGNIVSNELLMCHDEIEYIRKRVNGANIIMVASNHNEHLDRYIREERYDHINKLFCLKLEAELIENSMPAFEYDMKRRGNNDVDFLRRDQDFKRCSWKLDLHGDVGCNGARGSAASFDRVGVKCIVGHGHSPSIKRNVITVGTSTHIKLNYTKGLTSWLNTHAIIYGNGQAQLINIIESKWHGSSSNR